MGRAKRSRKGIEGLIKRKFNFLLSRLDMFSFYPVYYSFVMSTNEKRVFDELISQSKNYLEFGLGGSSLRALLKSKAKIFSVESSSAWIDHMRKYLVLRYYEKKRLYIFSVDIGPTGEWGYPKSDQCKSLYENYSSKVFGVVDHQLIDLVLIDGRFRVACTLKSIISLCGNKDVKFAIHDFWNRDHYHVVLKYLDVLEKTDTLGVFSIKEGVDLQAVEADYHGYKLDPR